MTHQLENPFKARATGIHAKRLRHLLGSSPRYDALFRERGQLQYRSGATGMVPVEAEKERAWLSRVWTKYHDEHSRFMDRPETIHAMSMLAPSTQSFVHSLVEAEHAFVSKALKEPETRVQVLRGFYGRTFLVRLYRELLPHDEMPGAYCRGRLQAVSSVKSWATWEDGTFIQSGVLRLAQMRGQLGIEPQQPPAAPIVNVPPQKAVVRTVERDSDGVISRLIDTPVEG